MDRSLDENLLDVLIENSSRILRIGFGLNWAESSFFDVVRLLREREELRSSFVARVRHTFAARSMARLGPGMVPAELVEVIAHELRWPELLECAQERVQAIFSGDVSLAAGDISQRLANAYQDDWEDREFYARYRTHRDRTWQDRRPTSP